MKIKTNCTVKPSYSMIEQYLSNKNEIDTVSKTQNFLDINKALGLV